MFIICPKCGAKYQIPAGTTLEIGQKLKCSACDFIFTKGEEAPLTLTSEQPVSPTPEAFSEPLYRESDLPIAPKEESPILPEAFQPVSPKSSTRPNLWIIIPLYLILIIILCIAGWSFRALLKPTLSDVMPQPEIVQKPIKHHPARTEAVIPKKTIQPKEVKKSKEPVIPSKPEVKVVPTPAPLPQPEVKAAPVSVPQKEEEPKPIPQPEPIIESPTPDPENIIPEAKQEIVPDDAPAVPLFEVVPPTSTTQSTLSVDSINFQTKPNESGILQLLVDGMIYNSGDTTQPVPEIIAFILNHTGDILTQKQIFVSETEVPPHAKIPFYTGITPAPEGMERVEVKLQGQK